MTPDQKKYFESKELCKKRLIEHLSAKGENGEDELKSVLIVDDDEDIRKILKRILNPLFKDGPSITIEEAENGQQALEIARETRDKLGFVISDIEMPEEDGTELAGNLRKEEIEVPVLLSSGDLGRYERDINRLLETGAINAPLPKLNIGNGFFVALIEALDSFKKHEKEKAILLKTMLLAKAAVRDDEASDN